MKNIFKIKSYQRPEFPGWFQSEHNESEYDFTGTSYYHEKIAEKNKKFFLATSLVFIIAINVFLFISFVL